MSPATPLDATAAVSTEAGAELTIRTPRRTRHGLHLLAVIAWPASVDAPDFEELGWDELARVENAVGAIAVLRRAATPDEPATYEFEFVGALGVGDPAPAGAMIVATGISDAALASDADGVAIVAGVDFTAPSSTAAAYSDVHLIAFYSAGDAGFVLADAGELLVDLAEPEASLAIAWRMPEQAGPTGTVDADALPDPVDGIAATFTLAATIAAQAPRWDDEIAIGLPTVGV